MNVIKNELLKVLEETQIIYFATANAEGIPSVRPLTLIYLDDQFWIATGAEDSKMKQIEENRLIEFCLPIFDEDKGGYARFSGTAEIISSVPVKTKLLDNIDFIKMFWNNPTDKGYGLLKINADHVEYMKPGEMFSQHFTW